jgi:hypothetical protein
MTLHLDRVFLQSSSSDLDIIERDRSVSELLVFFVTFSGD